MLRPVALSLVPLLVAACTEGEPGVRSARAGEPQRVVENDHPTSAVSSGSIETKANETNSFETNSTGTSGVQTNGAETNSIGTNGAHTNGQTNGAETNSIETNGAHTNGETNGAETNSIETNDAHTNGAETNGAPTNRVPTNSTEKTAPSVRVEIPDRNTEGWCSEGLIALDPETCVVVPESGLRAPRALVIYLHGTIDPRGDTQRYVQHVVAANARSRGFVAMLPRGVRGIGPNKIQDWWAWPTTAAAHARHAKAMTERWRARRADLEKILGAPFERTYLAGSSNGAYFLTVLALKGEFPADGYAALSGGTRGSFGKRTVAGARTPFYVGYGTWDETKTGPIALGELLAEAGWPRKIAAHPIGHGAHEIYLEEALPFFGGP